MTLVHGVVLGAALLACGMTAAGAQETGNAAAYVVTYLEVGAPATREAAGLLRQIAAADSRETGNLISVALEEIGRPDRLALVEGWRDKAALAAHQRAAEASGLAAKVQALLASPPDRRPNSALSVAPAAATATPEAVYVLTHVDIVPTAKEKAMPLIEQLARGGRKEEGNLFFDAWYQDSRPNHFTLFEAWRSPQAFDAYRTAAGTREFRRDVLPMQGALYDERLYRAVR
ncbi:MAG TPA: putative quinol monooxygenase [Stellaceae bacterium]|nr:putative quinol monooxygenase [Stellaceae bacterium]